MLKNFALRQVASCIAASLTLNIAWAATINTTATDPDGKPAVMVRITLTNANGKQIAQRATDPRGVVHFTDVPAGRYTVSGAGMNTSAAAREVEVKDSDVVDVTVVMVGVTQLPNIQVTATRLKEARIALSPKDGTTVYTIDQQRVSGNGQGDNTPMNEVLLQLPGVAQDSKASGSIHVRDEHANVQFRINGVTLPEGISGFGQSVDSRFVDHIDYVTGAVPAQYGMRTAGIVEIETKDGADSESGGSIGVLGGGHDLLQPSVEFLGSKGSLSYYFTGNYLTSSQGIENPTASRDALHDRTNQLRGFGYLSYLADADSRLALIAGTYQGRFQIPNNPDQPAAFSLAGVSNVDTGFNAVPSAQLDQNQREQNQYVVASLQQKRGALDYQASAFYQYSKLHYIPDASGGDLVYNGVSSDVTRSNSAVGLQIDTSWKQGSGHTPRFGATLTHQLTTSDSTVRVFATDDEGNPTSDIPLTIVDNSSQHGNLTGLYVQDEWRIDPRFTLNYGVRFDRVAAFTTEKQWSPRINALFKVTDDTAVHAGYARTFTPPPQELVAQGSIDLYANTTNAPEIPYSDTVKAERAHYFDVGASHKLAEDWTVAVDAYYKDVTNLLDEGQFGQALILTPFNYAQGRAAGVELSTIFARASWSGYFNLGISRAKGKNIVSGQSLFGADELAYIADHSVYLDHDQRYSLSGGLTYRFAGNTQLAGTVIHGSGLRNTPDGAPPNSGKLPSYTTMNLALVHQWKEVGTGGLEGRIGVSNLFDQSYLLRDGSGIGVGAPQYGGRRTWFAAISQRF